jgi:hypothetical protein
MCSPNAAIAKYLATVMPAPSRSKNGVASLAYIAGIHVFHGDKADVDGRNKPAMTAQKVRRVG